MRIFKRRIWCQRRLPVALFVWVTMVGVASAQPEEQTDAEYVEDLIGRAERTIERLSTYLTASPRDRVPPLAADVEQELDAFRGNATSTRDCFLDAVPVGRAFTTYDVFRARHDPEIREEVFRPRAFADVAAVVNLHRECRIDRLLLIPGSEPPELECCTSLTRTVANPEFSVAADLGPVWDGYAGLQGQRLVAELGKQYQRFERKLLNGFPAMPWEYVLNFSGGRSGPSPNQLIWLHPNAGVEALVGNVGDGQNRVQPVLALQVIGFNRYLFSDTALARRLNYLGIAAIATVNTTQGRDHVRYGGLIHVGNYLSVGGTHGDDEWRLYFSSDRIADQFLRLLP